MKYAVKGEAMANLSVNFNKQYEKELHNAFNAFVSDEENYDFSCVREDIYASWQRSKEYNIEYDTPVRIKKLDEKETKKLIKDKSGLIQVARKHLSKIYDIIKPTGFYIFISDERGILLDIIMDDEVKDNFERDPSLVIGASRSERYVGTNAIGTCLFENKPMVFWGEEHYNLVHKKYTCSGAPIRDANGNAIAAISITGKKESYQEHTLAIVISVAAAIEEELRQNSVRIKNNNTTYTFENIIGECEKMKETKELAKQVAGIDTPILLWGESGTGKEVFAQAIHNESMRKNKPFIGINCGAIPKDLIESELFGYDGGAFTGAKISGSMGKLEAANGGTLFLDEVESMPLDVQIKLLRALSTFKVTKVGSNEDIPIDIRIISATKKDLFIESEQGRFREDLYYRINAITLKIPPLRNREQDIRILADYYIDKVKKEVNIKNLHIPDEFYGIIENYDWKGNVRELKNIIEGAVSLSKDGGALNMSMLPERMTRVLNSDAHEQNNIEISRKKRLKEVEIEMIKNAIDFSNGNLSATAKALGMARSTLYQKINNNEKLSTYLKNRAYVRK